MSLFDDVSDAVSSAADGVAHVASAVADIVTSTVNSAVDGVKRIVDTARDTTNRAIDWVLEKVRAAGHAVSDGAAGVFQRVAGAFSGTPAGAVTAACPSRPSIQQITPSRKKGDAGFDEAKMYDKFKKSKTALALEAEVTKTGYKYAGDVSDPTFSAYTDVGKKEIRINKTHTEEEAALAYAYELQNAKNGPIYDQIFKDAQSGKIKDKKEFANRIMEHEVEALETEAKVADEMGIAKPPNKDVYDIVKNTKDETERRKKIREWADKSGQIQGKNPTEHYEQMYDDNYAKKKP